MEEDKNKIISHTVLKTSNECAFNKHGAEVCSPDTLVEKMYSFALSKGVDVEKTPKSIIEATKTILNCSSESCVLRKKDFMDYAGLTNVKKVLDTFFKPEGPSHDFGLLSNINIDQVLNQLTKKFTNKKFLHIPFQMRDFEKVGTELATVNLAKKFGQEGYDCFGVVLNTDWSHGNGIHWFCLYGEKKDNEIILEYFNSSGRPPLPEVQAWLHKTKHLLRRELSIPVDIYYNPNISFQDDNHSCGVYCLCYIWLRLEGVPVDWFSNETFNDSFMHEARKNLFRHEN